MLHNTKVHHPHRNGVKRMLYELKTNTQYNFIIETNHSSFKQSPTQFMQFILIGVRDKHKPENTELLRVNTTNDLTNLEKKSQYSSIFNNFYSH